MVVPVSLMSLFILMMGTTLGWSYQEVAVSNGGTIQGHISLAGETPRPMAFNLVTIPDAVYCGRISTGTGWRLVEDFIIGSHGELKDAVVMVKGVEKGKPFSLPKVEIEAIDCDFLPFVNVLRDKDEIAVINMDPVEHDIQGYETARERGARVLFNRPLPMNPFHRVVGMFGKEAHTHLPGEPMIERIHLRKGRNVFVMQCGFHPYMFSWGVVLENPYYSISKDDGAYEIKDIPAGEYEVAVWHPGMKAYLEKTVLVEEGKTLTLDFKYESPQGRRSVHEMQENPRFGLELLEEGEEIIPSLRRQIP